MLTNHHSYCAVSMLHTGGQHCCCCEGQSTAVGCPLQGRGCWKQLRCFTTFLCVLQPTARYFFFAQTELQQMLAPYISPVKVMQFVDGLLLIFLGKGG